MHPQHEFDGWMLGGPSKAIVYRRGVEGLPVEDPPALPGTWQPNKCVVPLPESKDGIEFLLATLPPRRKADAREVPLGKNGFQAGDLKLGDIIGCLFRCNRDGGAIMRVTVNGDIVATHTFLDAPPAEAVCFFTPVIRVAGITKNVKLFYDRHPPAHVITDFMVHPK